MPNPMNPSTRIPFELPEAGPASIRIYDPSGRLVRNLFAGSLPAGSQTVTWDGRGDAGRPLGSGVYYVRLDTAAGKAEQSVILIR
jgi:flagellar hook assembly protein FlgD